MSKRVLRGSVVLLFVLGVPDPGRAADHGDSPLLNEVGRNDAKITDLYAFTVGSNLVVALGMNPAVPVGVSSYLFPDDLEVRILIANDSPVAFGSAEDLLVFGGTLLAPGSIDDDVSFMLKFTGGVPRLETRGFREHPSAIRLFAGLRDDPFIRGPRIGRNVAAIVLEFPLSAVKSDGDTLLLWATTKVPDVNGPIAEHGGRALRSMFPENDVLNTSRPRDHFRLFGLVPDVVIFRTSQPARYPNGRALEDDVVDLVGDQRVLGNDSPFPSTNDKPFLTQFPYLAEPH